VGRTGEGIRDLGQGVVEGGKKGETREKERGLASKIMRNVHSFGSSIFVGGKN
jgi:hypothetical protein